jgi:hypothetical protein
MPSIVEFEEQFIAERALEALEGLDLCLSSDPELIGSMSPEEVREGLEELKVPDDADRLKDVLGFIRRKLDAGGLKDENELDVERDLIVAVPPVKRRKVKIRAKNLGRAKLRVVYDPLPDE